MTRNLPVLTVERPTFDVVLGGSEKEYTAYIEHPMLEVVIGGKTNDYSVVFDQAVTQCEILVDALPLRTSSSFENEFALEMCIANCFFLKDASAALGLGFEARIDRVLKNCFSKLDAGICVNMDVIKTLSQKIGATNFEAGVDLNIDDVCEKIAAPAAKAMGLCMMVDGGDISLGLGTFDLSIGIGMSALTHQEKYARLTSAAEITLDIGTNTEKCSAFQEMSIGVSMFVSSALRRYRYLSELNGYLSDYSDMSLDDISYVILQEG